MTFQDHWLLAHVCFFQQCNFHVTSYCLLWCSRKKDIFSKEIIAQRWTKQYNTCSNAADLDFVECEHNIEVDVMKYSEVSPCKKQKMSRHQKYRELMLLCKDFCDISNDFP